MDIEQTKSLLEKISVHYPAFGRRITGQDNFILHGLAEEWYRSIGYLDLDEALRNLDRYLSEGHRTAPVPMQLKNCPVKEESKSQLVQSFSVARSWTIKKGRLFDTDGYEYLHTPDYTGKYHLDNQGHICTDDGAVVEI